MTNKNNDQYNNDEQELKPMNQEQESNQQKHDPIIKPSSSKNSNTKRTVIEYRHSASPLTSLLIITLMITSIYIITSKSEASHPHGESYKIEDENNFTTTTATPFSSPTPYQTEPSSNIPNERGGKDVDNSDSNSKTQNYQQSHSPKTKRSEFLQTTCNRSVRSGAIFLFNLRPKLLSRPRSRMKTCQQTDVTSQTSCADQWLQQCWFLSSKKSKSTSSSSSSSNGGDDDVWTGQKLSDLYSTNNELKQIATCDPMAMKKFITSVIRMPRKAWVWRENATTFVGEAKIILQHDEMVLKMTCDEIERMSRYICLNFPFRPLEGEFTRRQRRSSNPKLDQFQIKDHLGLEYNFNVLEGIEFRTQQQQEQLDKNEEKNDESKTRRKRRRPKKTEVDLICSGMFQQNLVAAKALWSFAESTYFSKFDFRYRHFFQWNTVRDSRIRLVKAKRLYGQELTKRTEMIRSGVIGGEYQTWMTLDIDSPPADIKEQLMELFHQVTVLRFVAAKYLFTMDQLWKRGEQDESSSFKLADFIVWVRPDLAYHSAHLAQVIRHPKSFGDAIELRARVSSRNSRKLKQRNFVIRADLADEEVQTKKMYPEAPPLDPNRTNTIYVQDPFGSSGHLKVTDLFMFGNASGLIHLYSFLPSLLHSCIYHPTPIQFFVEYFLKIAANDYYHMHVQMIQFGAFIDRTGNENQTLPPTTEMP